MVWGGQWILPKNSLSLPLDAANDMTSFHKSCTTFACCCSLLLLFICVVFFLRVQKRNSSSKFPSSYYESSFFSFSFPRHIRFASSYTLNHKKSFFLRLIYTAFLFTFSNGVYILFHRVSQFTYHLFCIFHWVVSIERNRMTGKRKPPKLNWLGQSRNKKTQILVLISVYFNINHSFFFSFFFSDVCDCVRWPGSYIHHSDNTKNDTSINLRSSCAEAKNNVDKKQSDSSIRRKKNHAKHRQQQQRSKWEGKKSVSSQ